MREIKVRGYAVEEMVDSQWIYGTGVHKTTFTDEYAKETGKKYEYFIWTETGWVEVLGDSVGRYTGLKDKNGKEIYEGDVFEHNIQDYVDGFPREENHTKIVTYDNGAFWVGDYLLADAIANDSEAEVIGNIFEHSHLLEQHHDN